MIEALKDIWATPQKYFPAGQLVAVLLFSFRSRIRPTLHESNLSDIFYSSWHCHGRENALGFKIFELHYVMEFFFYEIYYCCRYSQTRTRTYL